MLSGSCFATGDRISCDNCDIRASQRSGEVVVRGNGCPKGCFWRVRFFSVPLEVALTTPTNLKGTEKKRTLEKHPFGQPFPRTTPSLHLQRTPIAIGSRKEVSRLCSGLAGYENPTSGYLRPGKAPKTCEGRPTEPETLKDSK